MNIIKHKFSEVTTKPENYLPSCLHNIVKGEKVQIVFQSMGLPALRAKCYEYNIVESGTRPIELQSTIVDSNLVVDLKTNIAGPVQYYLTYTLRDEELSSPVFGLVISPYSYSSISCETWITKLLGDISNGQWNEQLDRLDITKYNAIHLTPAQVLGHSNSSYSIEDPLTVPNDTKDWFYLKQFVKKAHEKGVRVYQDIVLNHLAPTAAIFYENPDCGYTLFNSPHLELAFVVDEVIARISGDGLVKVPIDFVKTSVDYESVEFNVDRDAVWGEFEGKIVRTEEDLDMITNSIKEALQRCQMWEFYVIDVNRALDIIHRVLLQLRSRYSEYLEISSQTLLQHLESTSIMRMHHGRHGIALDPSGLLDLVKSLTSNNGVSNIDMILKTFKEALDLYNLQYYRKYDDDLESICNNLKGQARWKFLDSNGPLVRRPLGRDNCFVDLYFSRINVNGSSVAFLNNGWSYHGGDFTTKTSRVLVRRELIAWGDCVKLRFLGPNDDDESDDFIWNYFNNYIQRCASVFDGFRMDNAHSTPAHVSVTLLDTAREINPDLFVFAELFTNDYHKDIDMTLRCGYNALVRELIHCKNMESIAGFVKSTGFVPVGSITGKCGGLPHMLYDQSHDNEPITDIFTVNSIPAVLSVLTFSNGAIGTTRGVDDLYPERICVVKESRSYWDIITDMHHARGRFNELRDVLLDYPEMNVKCEHNCLVVERFNPNNGKFITLIACLEFVEGHNNSHALFPDSINIAGQVTDVKFYVTPERDVEFCVAESDETLSGYVVDLHLMTDDDDFKLKHRLETPHSGKRDCYSVVDINSVPMFNAGSVLIVESEVHVPIHHFNDLDFELNKDITLSMAYDIFWGFKSEVETFGLDDSSMQFKGLGGFILAKDDEALRNNLMRGFWAVDYLFGHLQNVFQEEHPGLKWLRGELAKIPSFLLPKYFFKVVDFLYENLLERYASKLLCCGFDPEIEEIPEEERVAVEKKVYWSFRKDLALTAPQLTTPHIPFVSYGNNASSMAAGLPHFSSGWTRSWGRDTFLALPGLCIAPGFMKEARAILLDFMLLEKHGLLPNLVNQGENSRYNARDAVWWYLRSLFLYIDATGDSDILHEYVNGRPLFMNIYNILEKHRNGFAFTEENAGPQLDDRMQSEGFHVNSRLISGFPCGGNVYNCGTWMDKMGESAESHNRGIPATSRAGIPVEIAAMCACTVRWLKVAVAKEWITSPTTFDLTKWDTEMTRNFDKLFYIPIDEKLDSAYDIDIKFIQHRGIYKDVACAENKYEEYRLRCNVAVAMTTAPWLFKKSHAHSHLLRARELLLYPGMPGIKTLDPIDQAHNDFYHHGETNEYYTSGGFNYHNGPAWLWPAPFHAMAECQFNVSGYQNCASELLARAKEMLEENPMRGLPELLQGDGSHCAGSCVSQAWSSGCYLELLTFLDL
ncbi:hypothetical protein PCE1_003830 [Barthelona sp. PCE]